MFLAVFPPSKLQNDRNPLMYATRHGYLDVVNVLLKHGARVDERTKSGWTALFFALRWSHMDVMVTLLKAGASVNIKDKVQEGCGLGCVSVPVWDAAHLLTYLPPLLQASLLSSVPLASSVAAVAARTSLSMIIWLGCMLSCFIQSGRTPLMYACRAGMLDFVIQLVAHGADIRIKDEVSPGRAEVGDWDLAGSGCWEAHSVTLLARLADARTLPCLAGRPMLRALEVWTTLPPSFKMFLSICLSATCSSAGLVCSTPPAACITTSSPTSLTNAFP